MTELVLLTEVTQEQRDCLVTVVSSADDLLTLINEILDLSKIESNKTELDINEFDLKEAVFGCVKALAPQAHEKKLEIFCYFDASVPDRVSGDGARLRQIVFNLIGNAIKFTSRGEVEVHVKRVGKKMGKKINLQFSVGDTGIGIPNDKHDVIFRKFEQADPTTTRQYGGTGLGLSIVSELLKLMDGNLKLKSELGAGSTFYFTIPFRIVRERDAKAASVSLSGCRVLLIDDNDRHEIVLSQTLMSSGAIVESAVDGPDALRKITRNEFEKRPYDFIMADSDICDDSESDLMYEIEKSIGDGTNVIVMQKTSKRNVVNWTKAKREGTYFVAKPIEQQNLIASMVLAKKDLKVYVDADLVDNGSGVDEPNELNVLVVESSFINRKLAGALLKSMGHRVTLINNGFEAVELTTSGEFDMVLLDVHMPEMNGFQTARRIRKNEAGTGRRVSIIGVTDLGTAGDRKRCFESGMDEHIKTPIRPKALEELIDSFSTC